MHAVCVCMSVCKLFSTCITQCSVLDTPHTHSHPHTNTPTCTHTICMCWAPGVLPLCVCMCMCVCVWVGVFGGLSSFYIWMEGLCVVCWWVGGERGGGGGGGGLAMGSFSSSFLSFIASMLYIRFSCKYNSSGCCSTTYIMHVCVQ